MHNLPNLVPPYDDELLYSWLYRLSKINGLAFRRLINGIFLKNLDSDSKVLFDCKYNFHNLCNFFNIEKNIIDFFLEVTTFSYEIIGMNKAIQTRYVCNYFYDADFLNEPINTVHKTLYVCPKCIKEDIKEKGEAYIHRSHQLSGIAICHKHNVELVELNVPIDKLNNFEPLNCNFKPGINNIDVCKFAVELLNLNIDTCFEAIEVFLKEKGLNLPKKYCYKTGDLIEILYKYTSGNPLLLQNNVNSIKHNKKEYKLVHQSSILKGYIHKICGNSFVTCNNAFRIGYRCPCGMKKSYQERLVTMVQLAGDNEYEVISEFKSLNSPVKLKHKCGIEFDVKPRNFLFFNVRCPCNYSYTFDSVYELVKSLGDFELLDFKGTKYPLIIKSNSCGHIFPVLIHNFKKSPRCPICYPKHLNTKFIRKRIKEQYSGEFELVSDYVDYFTSIQIKHKRCGKVFSITPKYFYENPVCPYCSNHNVIRWNEFYKALFKYKKQYKNVLVPKNKIYLGLKLGEWCCTQRQLYSNGKLSDERLAKLNEIGFIFDTKQYQWLEKYNLYKEYILQYQTLSITRRTVYKGVTLGVWASTQKKRYLNGTLNKTRSDLWIKLFDLVDE